MSGVCPDIDVTEVRLILVVALLSAVAATSGFVTNDPRQDCIPSVAEAVGLLLPGTLLLGFIDTRSCPPSQQQVRLVHPNIPRIQSMSLHS